MAIWQWTISFFPRGKLSEVVSAHTTYMALEWFDSIRWWDDISAPDLEAFFNSLIPIYQMPWLDNSSGWGSDDGDRVTVTYEGERIIDLEIRVDVRAPNVKFLKSLVDFAYEKDFVFYSFESGEIIAPKIGTILEKLRESRKFQFVTNPHKFFLENQKYLDSLN